MELDTHVLDSMDDEAIEEVLQRWAGFCDSTEALLGQTGGDGDARIAYSVQLLCQYGLASLVQDHFLHALEDKFHKNTVSNVWQHFDSYFDAYEMEKGTLNENCPEEVLKGILEEISSQKAYHEKCILMLVHSLQSDSEGKDEKCKFGIDGSVLQYKYQLMVSSILLTNLPRRFNEVLQVYFGKQLEYLSGLMSEQCEQDAAQMSASDRLKNHFPLVVSGTCIGRSHHKAVTSSNHEFVQNIGQVVCDLRNLGFSSLTEDAYASAIFSLLKAKVYAFAGDGYRVPVLELIKVWIQAVPLQFLYALLTYLGDACDNDAASWELKSPLASRPQCFPGITMPSEGLVRWKLRLEYFAYETLQNLRIEKLFEIIVDYPESSPAIDDLKQCLEYTGQHSKLVDSFITSLRHRLLTAGASTNDILHQYISTIKALRTIDPTGVFLEAVGEPIRDYLRGRKDTIKCIVTMLTDGSGGNPSGAENSRDSLLEELNRDAETSEGATCDDDYDVDDKQAWSNAECWEPDPVAAGPSKGGGNRRKIDLLGMVIGIIGSKDQLINEYRVMLAERLLSKSDYDIDSEIRTLELLKIHFGESSMQKCEIMLNDLIDSKRTNTNIKVSLPQPSELDEQARNNVSLDVLDATIISSNFWPPIQAESLNIPASVNTLLSDYAKRFHQIKTPRKLLWLKNLGTVKLELQQFDDRSLQFTVAPVHAVIVMKFQEQASWNSKELADAIGIPVDALKRRIAFWINKGIIVEKHSTESDDHIFTIIDGTVRNDIVNVNCEDPVATEEEGGRSVASVEEQLQKEMTIYEKFIIGMLTNFGSMALDRIHNTLKMFCIAEPSYDKSLQQLESFLSCLVSEEKLDMKDGLYLLKQ